jgi:hypothetical protein
MVEWWPFEPSVRGSSPRTSNRSCSLMVKLPAHDGRDIGSNPVGTILIRGGRNSAGRVIVLHTTSRGFKSYRPDLG